MYLYLYLFIFLVRLKLLYQLQKSRCFHSYNLIIFRWFFHVQTIGNCPICDPKSSPSWQDTFRICLISVITRITHLGRFKVFIRKKKASSRSKLNLWSVINEFSWWEAQFRSRINIQLDVESVKCASQAHEAGIRS